MLVPRNVPLPPLTRAELAIAPIATASGTAKFDLTMFSTEDDHGLHLAMEYSTDLFEAETIDRMLGHFQTLLEAIVSDPNRPIADLPMLSEVERAELLAESNLTWDEDFYAELDDLDSHFF